MDTTPRFTINGLVGSAHETGAIATFNVNTSHFRLIRCRLIRSNKRADHVAAPSVRDDTRKSGWRELVELSPNFRRAILDEVLLQLSGQQNPTRPMTNSGAP